METKALTDTLEIIESETSGKKAAFGDVVQALNHRGFGPLIIAPALLTILPTGAIPGMPALSGLFILLIAGQIVAGRRYPWIPKRLKEFTFDHKKLEAAIKKAKPYTQKLDRFVRPRLEFFSQKSLHPVIALICCLLAVCMAVVGFIPFLPALLCLPIVFFALGITAKDGAMILCGFSLTGAAVFLILYLSGVMGGEDKLKIGRPIFIEQPAYSIPIDGLFDQLR